MSSPSHKHEEDDTKRVLVVYKLMRNALSFVYLFVVYFETFSVSKHVTELNDIMISE
jgi:hypothetical protein